MLTPPQRKLIPITFVNFAYSRSNYRMYMEYPDVPWERTINFHNGLNFNHEIEKPIHEIDSLAQ